MVRIEPDEKGRKTDRGDRLKQAVRDAGDVDGEFVRFLPIFCVAEQGALIPCRNTTLRTRVPIANLKTADRRVRTGR